MPPNLNSAGWRLPKFLTANFTSVFSSFANEILATASHDSISDEKCHIAKGDILQLTLQKSKISFRGIKEPKI